MGVPTQFPPMGLYPQSYGSYPTCPPRIAPSVAPWQTMPSLPSYGGNAVYPMNSGIAGPRTMADGLPLDRRADAFTLSNTAGRPQPMTGAYYAEANAAGLNRAASAISPAEQTVNRLEKPLIQFLEENPTIREELDKKLDSVNVEDLTTNMTGAMSQYRVALHNAFKNVPHFVDNTIIKQMDPNMQDSARQFFEWLRKPPSSTELAAVPSRTEKKAASRL